MQPENSMKAKLTDKIRKVTMMKRIKCPRANDTNIKLHIKGTQSYFVSLYEQKDIMLKVDENIEMSMIFC